MDASAETVGRMGKLIDADAVLNEIDKMPTVIDTSGAKFIEKTCLKIRIKALTSAKPVWIMAKVHHPNGYSGILYGKSSLAIYDDHGIEIIHTGYRTINTEKELYDVLEKFPEVLKEFLKKMDHDLLYGKDGERE